MVNALRVHWFEGMNASLAINARYFRLLPRLAVPVLVVYSGAFAYLAHLALAREISLGTVAVVLALMSSTQRVGSISLADLQVNWMLSAFPAIELLEADLQTRRCRPAFDYGDSDSDSDSPRHCIRRLRVYLSWIDDGSLYGL